MDRRTFIKAGVATAMILPSGCLLLALARFAVRGRFARAGARSARLSRRGTMASFGRASALDIYRTYRILNTLRKIEEVREKSELFTTEDNEKVVESRTTEKGCIVSRGGVDITESHRIGNHIEHHSYLHDVGVGESLIDGDVIEHLDIRGKFDGADRIDEKAGTIHHYDRNKDLVGISQSQIRVIDGRRYGVLTDDSYLMAELQKQQNDVSPALQKRLDANSRIQDLNRECASRPIYESCVDTATQVAAVLKEIERL